MAARYWGCAGLARARRVGDIYVMRTLILIGTASLGLSGCADIDLLGPRGDDVPVPAAFEGQVQVPGADTIRPLARPGEGATVPSAPLATGELGRSTVSLGDPTQGGLWLETPFVSVERPGRVSVPATGRFAQVTLRPGPQGGARASLQTLQTLGLSPAALTEIVIYGQ